MELSQQIRQRRQQLKLSVAQLAERLGVSAATMYRYENGGIAKLPAHMLAPLSRALDTTPQQLMGWEEPDAHGLALLGGAEGQRVPAFAQAGADFALLYTGVDMTDARILKGDIVYCRACSEVRSGDIAALLWDGRLVLRRVFLAPGKMTLRAENPVVADVVTDGRPPKGARIIGCAVAFFSRELCARPWLDGAGRPAAARGGGVRPQTPEQAFIAWQYERGLHKKNGEE